MATTQDRLRRYPKRETCQPRNSVGTGRRFVLSLRCLPLHLGCHIGALLLPRTSHIPCLLSVADAISKYDLTGHPDHQARATKSRSGQRVPEDMAQPVGAARVLARKAGILTAPARLLAVAFGPCLSTSEACGMTSFSPSGSGDVLNRDQRSCRISRRCLVKFRVSRQ